MASPNGFLSNHWGSESWCSDKGNSAAQARMIFSRHDVHLCRAAKLGQGALAHRTAHDWLDQTPRPRDLAADVNARGIERVDDRSESESEVTRRGVDRCECFRVAGTSTGNQV